MTPIKEGNVTTVLGPIPYREMGITDAHNDVHLWRFQGGSGLAGLSTTICKRLEGLGAPLESIQLLSGGNISRRLAGMI